MALALPKPITNYDAFKLVALVAMTVDHLGFYLFPQLDVLRVAGRAAAPIFCFLVGWNGSYRWRTSLLLAAIWVSGLNVLHGSGLPLNILWIILLGRLLMDRMDRQSREIPAWVMVLAALIWLPLTALVFDYATVGLMWMLWGRQHRVHPNSATCHLYAFAAFAGAVTLMQLLMPLPLSYAIAATAVLALTMVCLARFELRVYGAVPVLLRVSRHALLYYVLHLSVIVGASLLLGR